MSLERRMSERHARALARGMRSVMPLHGSRPISLARHGTPIAYEMVLACVRANVRICREIGVSAYEVAPLATLPHAMMAIRGKGLSWPACVGG